MSITWAAAGATRSNIWRGPVWNRKGSSASMRYWLKVKPPGATSGTHVDRRYTPSAISWMLVCMAAASADGHPCRIGDPSPI